MSRSSTSEIVENRYKDSVLVFDRPNVVCLLLRNGIWASGTARCCPEDEAKFDRNFGAEIAYRRAKADYHAKVAAQRTRIARNLHSQVAEMVRRRFGSVPQAQVAVKDETPEPEIPPEALKPFGFTVTDVRECPRGCPGCSPEGPGD
jgi:hypothetical protein